jgi:magnesium transporter
MSVSAPVQELADMVGMPPGSLVYFGDDKAEPTRITVIEYDEDHVHQRPITTIEDCSGFQTRSHRTWVNIVGLGHPEVLEKLGEGFGLHPLFLEDILNTEQRPKIEDMGDYVFIVLKSLEETGNPGGEVEVEQISLVLGPDYVLAFQEREGDLFEPVEDRLRSGKGRMRKLGADYLAYALIDTIVDGYFVVLERLGETIEFQEEKVVAAPTTETLQVIHHMKRDLIELRRAVWPLREIIGRLERGESTLIQPATRIYLRDLYDHTIQVIDNVETLRDICSGMLDIYLSSISNRMNEVMKVLTIISTIFIPLTFLAGVYGMNFQHMPELSLRWTYPVLWVVMIGIAITMLAYFRRKRWL